MKRSIYAVIAVLAVAAIGYGSADASGLINGGSIKEHTVTFNKLTVSAQAKLHGVKGAKGDKGDTGARGGVGATGAAGSNGLNGAKGDSYLAGAYYSVAYYDVGDTNQGAIATVACKVQTDTAISGGVSVDDPTKNAAVGQSFPGREDWTTNTPFPGRLDGWIVQFESTVAPLKVKVWALCVPNLNVPVITTYTESA